MVARGGFCVDILGGDYLLDTSHAQETIARRSGMAYSSSLPSGELLGHRNFGPP
jgi:hypothetical protein